MKTSHFNFFIENIAHLDIKPENFVGTNVSDQSVLPVFKLIDFGTCEFMENHYIKSITKEILGTDVYIAPEIDRREEYKQVNLFFICIYICNFGKNYIFFWERYT